MRRALAVAAVATLALTGCGASQEPAATEQTPAASASAETSPAEETTSATEDPSQEPSSPDHSDALAISIQGDRIEPTGRRVEVAAGEPVVLMVRSDRPAELHVHSSPEQELQVKRGRTHLSLTIERPGIVDIEEHESGIVVLQLEVR